MIFGFAKDDRGRGGLLRTYLRMCFIVCVRGLMPFYKAVIKVSCCPIGVERSRTEMADNPKMKAGQRRVREMVRFVREKGLT